MRDAKPTPLWLALGACGLPVVTLRINPGNSAPLAQLPLTDKR
jgi:hypothetical protein